MIVQYHGFEIEDRKLARISDTVAALHFIDDYWWQDQTGDAAYVVSMIAAGAIPGRVQRWLRTGWRLKEINELRSKQKEN